MGDSAREGLARGIGRAGLAVGHLSGALPLVPSLCPGSQESLVFGGICVPVLLRPPGKGQWLCLRPAWRVGGDGVKSTKVVGGDLITDGEATRSWLLPWWSCSLHRRFPTWKL